MAAPKINGGLLVAVIFGGAPLSSEAALDRAHSAIMLERPPKWLTCGAELDCNRYFLMTRRPCRHSVGHWEQPVARDH